MQQHEIRSPNSVKKARRRVGRGDSSGFGSYSGKGMKGQNARSGGGVRLGFQGGGLPLIKSLPMMRGFTNIHRIEFNVVNVDALVAFSPNSEVTPDALVQAGVLKDAQTPLKILGRGELEVPLNVAAHKFSRSAKDKIVAAGGSVREIQ